jgi:farnesyl diphosphate synthase
LNAAAALELVHCYSLIHDDLPAMDDDDVRRGQPTVHRAFDEATAILAGDGLLTMAFQVMADSETSSSDAVKVQLIAALAAAAGAGGMAGGQILDLAAEGRFHADYRENHGEARIVLIQSMKTGALIRFACEAGALLAGPGEGAGQALASYGSALGLAFQIKDDLLDAEGDAETLGKAAGKDAKRGKATFVDLLGAAGAAARLRSVGDDARAALAPFGDKANALLAMVDFNAERTS